MEQIPDAISKMAWTCTYETCVFKPMKIPKQLIRQGFSSRTDLRKLYELSTFSHILILLDQHALTIGGLKLSHFTFFSCPFLPTFLHLHQLQSFLQSKHPPNYITLMAQKNNSSFLLYSSQNLFTQVQLKRCMSNILI